MSLFSSLRKVDTADQGRADGDFCPSIHAVLESIPAGSRLGAGYTLDGSPVNHWTDTHTHTVYSDSFRVLINLKFTFLNSGRKVKKTHTCTLSTWRLRSKRRELESTPTPSVLPAQREYSVSVTTASNSAGGRI